jgi:hypothetical protein
MHWGATMVLNSVHLNRIIIPLFFGIGMLISGQLFIGLIITAIGTIFLLRLLEEYLKDKAAKGHYSSDPRELLYERIIDSISFYSQQMTSVFFACMFWMVLGDLRLLTLEHWQVALHTALYGASVLTLIKISPAHPLLQSRLREFLVMSSVVAMIDQFVHPSHFGGPYTEAITTGLTAVGINMSIDGLFELFSYLIRF